MPHALIAPVSDYSDTIAIRNFVKEALDLVAPIVEKLYALKSGLIVVKPNWVQESHENNSDIWEPVITHPAVLLAVIEELCERLRGCTVCICDAPNTYANFEKITARADFTAALEFLRARFPAMKLELLDLRREIWIVKEQVIVERRPAPLDPRGYSRLDLARESMFYRHHGQGRYYGADYDTSAVNSHHQGDLQEYLLAGTPMACDLFINVPKLKTHKKTGITCSLKNLVGINGDKNWLPHHTEGYPTKGGDEFPEQKFANRMEGVVKSMGRRVALGIPGVGTWIFRKARNAGKSILGDSEMTIRNGNWHGNDTCWRMALDLNRALLYGNHDGTWGARRRGYLSIVDGIIGGEGNGPLCPDPIQSRVLLCGTDPAIVDAVACQLMGFLPETVPLVANAFAEHRWSIATCAINDVRVFDRRINQDVALNAVSGAVLGGFQPHFGWKERLGSSGAAVVSARHA